MNQIYTHTIYKQEENGSLINESNIVHISGTNNEQFQIDYDSLDNNQKKKYDDFIEMVKSLNK